MHVVEIWIFEEFQVEMRRSSYWRTQRDCWLVDSISARKLNINRSEIGVVMSDNVKGLPSSQNKGSTVHKGNRTDDLISA